MPLEFVRSRRARRYILRMTPNGVARVTLPPHGSIEAARLFVLRHVRWIERQRTRQITLLNEHRNWTEGHRILFRGETYALRVLRDEVGQRVVFGDQSVPLSGADDDLRWVIELHLWRLAASELPARVTAFAAGTGLPLRRVVVRNQRSRWGSCSRRGTVSLNWRLIQTPQWVTDYLIWHELMHLREMNHSQRFWDAVARVYPEYESAERWLRKHKNHFF